MKKNIFYTVIFLIGLILSKNILADGEYIDPLWENNTEARVLAVDNDLYKRSCGSCHEAYPAGLLAPQSWEKIMMNLNTHFNQKIVLNKKEQSIILNYLLGNAAGRAKYKLSHNLIEKIKTTPPIRITKLPYFIKRHQGITDKLTNCSNCHTQASQGSYDKKEVKESKNNNYN